MGESEARLHGEMGEVEVSADHSLRIIAVLAARTGSGPIAGTSSTRASQENSSPGYEKTVAGADLCSGRRGRHCKLQEFGRCGSNGKTDRENPRDRFRRRRSGL